MRECVTHHHACDCREAMFARALEIADEAMTALPCAHTKRADEHGVMWALCDADGGDVATLAEADTPLIEAVEWLEEWKLCDLVESPNGATVLLLSEIGEAMP
jgi:hypothetical protein